MAAARIPTTQGKQQSLTDIVQIASIFISIQVLRRIPFTFPHENSVSVSWRRRIDIIIEMVTINTN